MKTIKKIILFTILAASFAFMGCDQLAGANKKSEPEITKKTFSDADRNDENYPKNDIGQPLFPEGTTIDFKKVEEDDLTTIDYTATLPDGTITVFHEKFEAGKIETTTSTSSTTFPDTSEKETEVVEITDKNGNAKTGNQKDKKTTTKYKDGTIITETSNSEGKTSKLVTSKETVKPDGSIEKETFSTENVDDDTNTKAPYAISKSYLKKDANGNITQDVKTTIEAQSPDGESNIVKGTTITTNYSGGAVSGSTVEIMQYVGENDGLFTKETKDASGKTTLTEKEYLFFEKSGYENHHGVNDDYNRMKSIPVKVILKDDGTSKKARITAGESFPNDTYNHKVFVTTLKQDITQIKFEDDKITILRVGAHEEYNGSEWNLVGGTEVNDVYTIDENLTLSFDSKF